VGPIGGAMVELLGTPVARLVIWTAVLSILLVVVFYIIGRVRPTSAKTEPISSELLSKFRNLRDRGEISEAEFQTIKATLAERLREELKDNGETGCDE